MIRSNSKGAPAKRGLAILAVLALAAAACSPSAGTTPPRPVFVDVEMSEYRFDYDPPRIREGRAVFRAVNKGRLNHELVLILVPPEIPPILEQLRSTERQIVARMASFPERAPGRRGVFAVDLEPGRYALVCFVTDPDGVQHGQKGMASEFSLK